MNFHDDEDTLCCVLQQSYRVQEAWSRQEAGWGGQESFSVEVVFEFDLEAGMSSYEEQHATYFL